MSETEKKPNNNETRPETEVKDPEVMPVPPAVVPNAPDKKPNATRERLRQVGKNMPVGPGNFWNNMLSTVLLLVFITAAFSYLTDTAPKPTELSISDVVAQVKSGEVKEIIVRGTKLDVSYNDTTKVNGEAKRETDAAVSESLKNLGVSDDQLSKIKIQNFVESF